MTASTDVQGRSAQHFHPLVLGSGRSLVPVPTFSLVNVQSVSSADSGSLVDGKSVAKIRDGSSEAGTWKMLLMSWCWL